MTSGRLKGKPKGVKNIRPSLTQREWNRHHNRLIYSSIPTYIQLCPKCKHRAKSTPHGMLHYKLGKFTERFPKNSLGWFNLALMQGVRGNCTAALPALERALAIDPQLVAAAQRDRRLEGCRGILQSLRISMPAPPPKLGR